MISCWLALPDVDSVDCGMDVGLVRYLSGYLTVSEAVDVFPVYFSPCFPQIDQKHLC